MGGTPKGIELEATIAELAPGGDGLAICEIRGERRAVFVPAVARGERVRLSVDDSAKPARGRVLEILSPSPSRVTPACPHVQRCGGCDWMHLAHDEQARAHATIVERVLPEAMRGVPIRTHAAPRTLGYRTRTRVHVDVGRSGKVTVGMFARGTHAPAQVDACVVLDPVVEAARRSLEPLLAGSRGRGEASIAIGEGGAAVIELRWSGDLPASVFATLERAVREKTLAGARVFSGAVKIPATIGDPGAVLAGADGAPLRLGPGGFSQASEGGNTILASRAIELARAIAQEGAPAVELYAGAGNLTVMLARHFKVLAVESSREACDAARKNLAARVLEAKVTEADAAAYAIPKTTKLVVLDPPRTGAKEVAAALARSKIPAVLYVSCDPPTLGRDLATLAATYEARAIETFEMFPQTSHVETVVALVRGP